MALDSTLSPASDGTSIKFAHFTTQSAGHGRGSVLGVLVFINMTTIEEPEPLELGGVRKVPNSGRLGCCALFRKFEDKDVPGPIAGWTCLGISKTPYGQTLNHVLQNELSGMRHTRATHFLAISCSSEIELAAVHKGLCTKYQPLSTAWPPKS